MDASSNEETEMAAARDTAGHPQAPHVRSFVKRSGRITPGQRNALNSHWMNYGVEWRPLDDLDTLFPRHNPVTLEIGFGAGDTLLRAAIDNRQQNFIGIEVYEPGIGQVLKLAAAHQLDNLRLFNGDAVDALALLPNAALEAVWLFFPDPWPKKRHHKRRIVNSAFVRTIQKKLRPGGHLLLATDWEEYAHQMLEVLDTEPSLRNSAGAGNFARRPIERVDTRFAKRGLRLGHQIWDLSYERSPSQVPRGIP